MLLSFKFKNYKSFIDGAKLDMTKKPKQTELDYSILEENCKKKSRVCVLLLFMARTLLERPI